jgi:hypothetical protein
MSRAIPLLPCGPFVACYRVTFTFTIYCSWNALEEIIGLEEEKYSTINANEKTSVSKMYRK